MDNMTVNQRLRSIRRAKGLTLEELAQLTGTQGSYLGRIERGVADWAAGIGYAVQGAIFELGRLP